MKHTLTFARVSLKAAWRAVSLRSALTALLLAPPAAWQARAADAFPAQTQDHRAAGEWSFDGDLLDRSGWGNNALAVAPVFAPGHSGQGLRCGQAAMVVPDSAELRPAPGLRIECWVAGAAGEAAQPTVLRNGDGRR